MTTLTPETALERLVVHTAMEDAAVAMECEAALKPLLAALSTERQARESTQFLLADRSTELDWERSARQAGEKEVGRLRGALADLLAAIEMIEGSGGRKTYRLKTSLPRAYAHALSALPPPEEACAHKWFGKTSTIGPRWECSQCREITDKAPTQAPQDVAQPIVTGDAGALMKGTSSLPQDVAGLVEGDLEWLRECVEEGRVSSLAIERLKGTAKGGAYVAQNARIDRILSALRASPISHETKGLVLAAADNNHKALVEALRQIARAPTGPHHCEGLGGVDPDCARASETVEIAKAALAAFQSRQEGGVS